MFMFTNTESLSKTKRRYCHTGWAKN